MRNLARSSLLALVSASATGCLVTDVPDYQEPSQTPPFMIESTASPPTFDIIPFVKGAEGLFSGQTFSVQVRSQDTTDEDLEARFWLSGRSDSAPVGPFNAGAGGTLPPSTLFDTSRVLTKIWKPFDGQMQGCYELFWILSHDIDSGDTDCPADPADFAQISWTILVCDSLDSSACTDTVLPECEGRDQVAVPCTAGAAAVGDGP